MADSGERGKQRREIAAIAVAATSAAFAAVAFVHSCDTGGDQRDFEKQVAERELAPLVAPGVEPEEKTKKGVIIPSSYGNFRKPAEADRLWADTLRMVVPVRNVGEGLAVLNAAQPIFVKNCGDDAESLDPGGKPSRGGYYNIPPGESYQLSYRIPERTRSDFRTNNEDREFKSYRSRLRRDYRQLAKGTGSKHVLLSYTDSQGQRWRWTCSSYQRDSVNAPWALLSTRYGEWE